MDTLPTINGCDSILTQQLTIDTIVRTNELVVFCESDSVQINGDWYYTSQTFEDTLSTVATGCDSIITYTLDTDTVTNNLDIGEDFIICVYDSMNLSVSLGYDSYLWNTGATANEIVVSGANYGMGTFDFWVDVTQGTCLFSDTIQITIDGCIGIKEMNATYVQIYPNPTVNELTIESDNRIESLKIYDNTGREIKQLNKVSSTRITIETAHYKKGVYTLVLNNNTAQKIQFIKQ